MIEYENWVYTFGRENERKHSDGKHVLDEKIISKKVFLISKVLMCSLY